MMSENSLNMKFQAELFRGNMLSKVDKGSPEVLLISVKATQDHHPFGGHTTNPFDKLSIADLC